MFDGLYPDKDDQLGDEEPTDDIAEDEEYDIAQYEKVDEGILGDVFIYNEEDVECVDFLGIENILNFPTNDVDEFYTDEKNYMFTRESVVDPFLSILMARGREKERNNSGKSKVLPSGVQGIHDRHQGIPMMRSVILILRGYLVILRIGEWNELSGHPKDRGKDRPNLRTNSLQQGENDADCVVMSVCLIFLLE